METDTDIDNDFEPTLKEKVTGALTVGAPAFLGIFTGTHNIWASLIGAGLLGAGGTVYGDTITGTLQGLLGGVDTVVGRFRRDKDDAEAYPYHPISEEQVAIIHELCQMLNGPVPADLYEWSYEEAKQAIAEVEARFEQEHQVVEPNNFQQELDESDAEAERQIDLILQQEREEACQPITQPALALQPLPRKESVQPMAPAYPRQQMTATQPRPVSSTQEMVVGVNKKNNTPVVLKVKKFFGNGAFIAGSQESGKSTFVAMFCEKISEIRLAGGAGIPMLILDWKGEYASLAQYMQYGLVAGYTEGLAGTMYHLMLDGVGDFVEQMMSNGWRVVFDIQSYALYETDARGEADGKEYGALVAAELLRELMKYAARFPSGERPPCFVVIDEAHQLAPKTDTKSELSSQITTKTRKAINLVSTTGRSYGFTVIAATQRIQQIDNSAIQSLTNKIIMRHTLSTDINRCGEELGIGNQKDYPNLQLLESGGAYVIGAAFSASNPIRVHFEDRKSKHQSITPNLEHAERFYTGRTRRRYSEIMSGQVPTTESGADYAEAEDGNDDIGTNVVQFQRTGTDNSEAISGYKPDAYDMEIIRYTNQGFSMQQIEDCGIGIKKSAIGERVQKLRRGGFLK